MQAIKNLGYAIFNEDKLPKNLQNKDSYCSTAKLGFSGAAAGVILGLFVSAVVAYGVYNVGHMTAGAKLVLGVSWGINGAFIIPGAIAMVYSMVKIQKESKKAQ